MLPVRGYTGSQKEGCAKPALAALVACWCLEEEGPPIAAACICIAASAPLGFKAGRSSTGEIFPLRSSSVQRLPEVRRPGAGEVPPFIFLPRALNVAGSVVVTARSGIALDVGATVVPCCILAARRLRISLSASASAASSPVRSLGTAGVSAFNAARIPLTGSLAATSLMVLPKAFLSLSAPGISAMSR